MKQDGVKNIIIIVLLVTSLVATAASVFFYTRLSQLQVEVAFLNTEVSTLTGQNSALNSQVNELENKISEYKVSISELENYNEELENKLSSQPIKSETQTGQLSLFARLENNKIQALNQLNVTLQLINIGDSDLKLIFPTPQIFDFKILKGNEEVYRWSSDRFFIQVIRTVGLRPRETLGQTLTWVVDLSPGTYNIVGSTLLFIDEKRVAMETPRLTIEVVP